MVTPHDNSIVRLLIDSGKFDIREDGTVWRDGRRAENQTRQNGYLQVRLMVNGKRYHVSAHRLVWTRFRGNIPAGLSLNHINGIKPDNRLVNLELVTASENMIHAHATGLKDQTGEKNPHCKLSDIQVAEIRSLYQSGVLNQAQIASRFGVAFQTVSRIVRGDRRSGKSAAGRVLDGRTWDEFPHTSAGDGYKGAGE